MSSPVSALSKREKQVCDLVCHGFTNKEIATRLDLSVRTIEDYRYRLMNKYRVDNVVRLVRAHYKLDEVTA